MTGKEIKALRKKLGLSQEKFAREVGVTLRTVSAWENATGGHPAPSQLAINRLRELEERSQG